MDNSVDGGCFTGKAEMNIRLAFTIPGRNVFLGHHDEDFESVEDTP